MANVITDGRFPYWSDAFSCEVRSRSHLRELERRHGVTPITQADLEASTKAIRRENEEMDARFAEQDALYEQHPSYARAREMRARGAFTQHLPAHVRDRAQKKLMERAAQAAARRTKR